MGSDWPEGTIILRQHWHFHARLYERYGLILEPGGFSEILRQIRDGRAVRLPRDRYAVRVHQIHKGWKWVYVVAPRGRDLATVVHPNAAIKNARRATAATTPLRSAGP